MRAKATVYAPYVMKCNKKRISVREHPPDRWHGPTKPGSMSPPRTGSANAACWRALKDLSSLNSGLHLELSHFCLFFFNLRLRAARCLRAERSRRLDAPLDVS